MLIWVILILGIAALRLSLILVSQPANAQILTDHNFTIYYNDPASHVGQYVILTGKIFNTLPSSEGYDGFQMYLSGDNKKNIAVFYNASEVANESNEDDCVRVTGTTTEKVNSQNAFGGELSIPGINAVSLKKISCLELVDPEAKIVSVNQIQDKGGIKVTLHKVELTIKETRVFLTVENTNKNDDVQFYPSDSLALVGNKQYDTKYSTTYPQIRSTIPEGIREDGVIVFEPVEHKDGKFRFKISKGFSEDYPFVFDVPLSKADWKNYMNVTLGLSLEYPVGWDLNSTNNSMCDPVTGTCFTIELTNESINADSKTFIEEYRQVEAKNSSDMIESTKISNYTIDGEPSAEGIRRLSQSETGDIVHQKEILTMHDGKIYFLFLDSYPIEMEKPETKEILDHIIKSIKWSQPTRTSIIVSSLEPSKPTSTSVSKPQISSRPQANSSTAGSHDLSTILANAQKSLSAKTSKK